MLTTKDCEELVAERHADYLAEAIDDLRGLLAKIGRSEFRAYGYSKQLRSYRARVAA